MMNTKYKMNGLAKDFGIKTKDFAVYAEKAGLKGKSNMAALTSEEFDALMTVLTGEFQITDMADYLQRQSYIKVVEEVPAPVKAEEPKTKEEPKKEDKTVETTKKKEEQKQDQGNKTPEPPAKKTEKTVPPVQPAKSKEELAAEKQARFKDALQKQMELQAQKQAKQAQKQQEQQKKQQQQTQQQKTVAPVAKEPMTTVTTLEEKSSRVAGTRVVDTRSAGHVDLSKYDEKLEGLVDTNSKQYAGGTQKLKKQNNRQDGKGSKKNQQNPGLDRFRNQQQKAKEAPKKQLEITIPDEITVNDLAQKLKRSAPEVVKKLMMMGMMVGVTATIDYDTAYLVADEFGAKVNKEVVLTIEDKLFDEAEDQEENLQERPPVVCVMGHVDHGKTSLLDAIRHTRVTAGEAGGITQHIGAYRVQIDGKDLTFLDTPGHEAFTAMRARGAKSTDIAILVVAADDGIMPQTVEAINHARAANIDIIVAINKMDKPHANPDQVMQGLTQHNLVPEAWGGDVICVPVSALTGMGIDELLENVLLVAEMKQLKANPARRASGLVIEAKLDRGRGPVATLLVQNGTLHSGDIVIAGTAVGRVRAMTDERGKQMKTAGPSVPVEIIGLAEVPMAGDEFNAVEDERMARELAEQRKTKIKEDQYKSSTKVSLDDLFNQISAGAKELNVIVKADVGGSAEAVKASLEKLSGEEVKVRVIHSAV
ncbi:MAG: translation initiation factor IF-2, partial [Clostridia bacterium]|nr:translation initiation factor IF-2 [Clostridia bacterium]